MIFSDITSKYRPLQLIVDRNESREEEEDVEKGGNSEEVPETSGVFPTGPSPAKEEDSPRAGIHTNTRRCEFDDFSLTRWKIFTIA